MSQSLPAGGQEVVCPHCRKTFTADLLGEPGDAKRGFKCPHCRLFVPSERAVETELTA